MKAVKEFVVPAAVLTVICIVVSAALAGTYNVTEPIIEAAKKAEADAARVVVLPDGSDFEELDVSGLENIVDAYAAGNGAGYVITAVSKGYGGDMQVMVGIDSEGKITGAKLMSNSETQGIGSKTGDESYTSQYIGKDSTLEGVNAISGATISSTAFKTAVGSAFQAYGSLAGVEVAGPDQTPPENVIFPDVTDFEEITVEGAKKAMKAGDAGYILVMESQGYTGAPSPMEVYVGIDMEGKIAGVAVGENSETAGIGTQAMEASYLEAYIGQTSPDNIENVSGATQTSVGIKKAVRAAMELVPSLLGEGSAEGEESVETMAPADEGVEVEAAGVEKAILYSDGSMTITASGAGYRSAVGDVYVTVTITADGKIDSLSVDASIETVGVGSLAEDASYTDSWKGLGAGEAPAAISGATMTSNAVSEAVNKAFAAFNASKGA
jgi:electron transport complex protein RnfG